MIQEKAAKGFSQEISSIALRHTRVILQKELFLIPDCILHWLIFIDVLLRSVYDTNDSKLNMDYFSGEQSAGISFYGRNYAW